MSRDAVIITIGSELVAGERTDTHTAEIARALKPRGFEVVEATSVGDRVDVLTSVISRALGACELIVITGGLGPTHDDVTREAVSQAVGLSLIRDERLVELLRPAAARHSDPEAAAQVFRQADVLPGAEVIDATTGTAPGQILAVSGTTVALLPGPPSEMRPMLASLLSRYPLRTAGVRELGVTGLTESDAQVIVTRCLAGVDGIGFTILAKPGDVRVLLSDEGSGVAPLERAVTAVREALGEHCYSVTGESIEEVVVSLARSTGRSIVTAESCTGGMVAARLTSIPGASDAFIGGVVAYANEVKTLGLGVPAELIDRYGAVSEECVVAMAVGALERLGADLAVAVSGIAGPGGGTADKPVGTVWFGTAVRRPGYAPDAVAFMRSFPPTGRESIRDRASGVALDALRRRLMSVPD